MQRILVVEDEMQIARNLRDYLEVAGFEVTVVGDGSAAVASARGDRPDLVVLDLGLPGHGRTRCGARAPAHRHHADRHADRAR